MSDRTLVVYCHPYRDSLIGAACTRVLTALTARGDEVRVIDLYAGGFDPIFSAWEREHHHDPPETKPEIAAHVDALRWCSRLVFVYPTWWSAQPAMLKGWIDRVWVDEVAWHLPPGSTRIRPLLTNIRELVVVTTHGSSRLVNFAQGDAGRNLIRRSLRFLCGWRTRVRWIALYRVDTSTPAQRQAFLANVERRLAQR
jgi:putative NADPH-quinone reductase